MNSKIYVVLIVISLLLVGCGGNTFVITDKAFNASYEGDCKVDVQIQAEGDNYRISGTQEVHDGNMTIWCYGAKHTFMGKVSFSGYTFDSNENEPLQFVVESDGYKYVSGKGTVTSPDGNVTSLP